MKKSKLLVLSIAASLTMTFPSFAGQWHSDANGWWYQNDDGTFVTNQWQEIDGKLYYFGNDGYMLSGTTTPDGHVVGTDGALIVDVQPQTPPKSYSNLMYSADSVTNALAIVDYKFENYGTTYHIFEITNNSPYTLELNINETAKDAHGNVIGAHSTSEEAIPSGCTVFVRNIFIDVENVGWFDTTIQATQDTWFTPVIQNVVVNTTKTRESVIVSATNTGAVPAEYVEATALFFKGNELIYCSTRYITDGDSEIKPGATLSEQIRCYEDFDSVKVHITGRKGKW